MKISIHFQKQARRYAPIGICLLALLLTGWSPSVVKPKAQDQSTLKKRLPAKNLLETIAEGEQAMKPGPAWLADVNPVNALTFMGITGEPDHAYGLLLKIDPKSNRLFYAPLSPGDTPLTILADSERRASLEKSVKEWTEKKKFLAENTVRTLSLDDLTSRLTSPIPRPGRIYAVAANYPSHLFIDLSLPDKKKLLRHLKKSRPRIFQKYPPVPAPGESAAEADAYAELPTPYGILAAPEQVQIPTITGLGRSVPGHLDYEVEIAVMIGQDLSWDEVEKMDDHELRRTIAGYLLISDAKVRDPQVTGRIVRTFVEDKKARNNSYGTGYDALDVGLGTWDPATCHWWSYAASWGHYASLGPFLVTAPDQGQFPPRMILSARSYTSSAKRKISPPEDVPSDRLLLRQAALTSTTSDYQDALIWDLPTIIRSLLNPTENALAFTSEVPALQAGDLIALGTPGGTVISAKPWWLLPVAETLLFWKGPDDFYDLFFDPTEGYYLHPGDELFLWGEGLGYQHLRIAEPGSK